MFNKRLKQELAALREELSSLVQVKESLESEMLVLNLEPDGRIQSVNQNFLTEMLYKSQDLIGRAIEDIVPAHVKSDEFHHRFKNAMTRGEHFAGAVRLLRGNGEEAWLRSIVQPVRSSDGRIKHISLFASDLTRTIEASREHENLIGALVRSTAVIEFDLNGNVLNANDRFLSGMGYSLAQIKGKHHRLFCTPEEYNSAEYQNFWRRLNNGEFVADRFKRVDSHGRTVWLEASYNPVVDANNKLYKVVKFATVITDQVNREQAVADAASIAYSTSQQTDSTAQRGTTVVTEEVNVIRALSRHMQAAGVGVGARNAQCKVSGHLAKTITGSAEQTNLLALDGGSGAARGDERGGGFGGVADGGRQLASRSSQPDEESVTVGRQKQGMARNAVALMTDGKLQAEQGLALAAEAGTVIVEIQDGAQKVVNAVGQFANQLSN
ncbi:PAS domain-containing methyl-accepting chemotaxis protein [Pseudomonas fluorescens]|uniref:Biofilm dispersion protein BdlA n=1 Tax=Pseudomonas fluorescens TaxID=294 RepID=A0A5E6XV58_PSEFL|nr:PAS domain-containing methyl-accepting chemotaxis protein [Pseudomonas fluorescens]VVN45492.1 Biofilm dispersion protein BdlA [Pseudomonas fluorescens]